MYLQDLPKKVKLTSEEIREALKDATGQIVEAVHGVLEKTPPELAADIVDRGIVLAGGGALRSGNGCTDRAEDRGKYSDCSECDACGSCWNRQICRDNEPYGILITADRSQEYL